MFTGIVTDIGTVLSLKERKDLRRLRVASATREPSGDHASARTSSRGMRKRPGRAKRPLASRTSLTGSPES